MTRVHYFSFIADDNGQPIPGVNISIYLAGTIIPANLYLSEFGGSIISESPQLITNEKGYFEFWVGSEEDSNGYGNNQKFKITWEKPGITSGYIDWIDIFPQFFGVDEESYTSTVKNKTISNRLAYLWETHRNHDVTVDFFPVHGLESFGPLGDSCAREGLFTVEQEKINKVISDKYAYTWDNHAKYSFSDIVSSVTSTTSATSASSGSSESFNTSASSGGLFYPDIYNTTAHGLQPVEFNDNDLFFNKLVSNDFMSKFVSRDGIQSFTDPVSGSYPLNDDHLATKKYIDDFSTKITISNTSWTSTTSAASGEYITNVVHDLDEEYPNITIWNTDTKEVEDLTITTIDSSYFQIRASTELNLIIKVSK